MTKLKDVFFLLLIFSVSLKAQNEIDYLTIEDAITFAIKNNPSIQSIEKAIDIKRAEKWKSLGIDTPEISYMKEGVGTTNTPYFERRYTISQTLDFPLKSIYNYGAYTDEVSSLELNYQSQKRDLIVDVKSSYVNVLAAIAVKELGEQQLELSENLYKAVSSKVEAGVSSELELLKAKIKLDESKNDLSDASQAYHNARYSLFNIVGLDPEVQSYAISFEDTLSYHKLELDQESILELIPNQPSILAIDAKLTSADQKVSASWSSLLPNFNLSYYVQDIGTGFNYHGYEIGLSIPVWFMINESQDIKIAKTESKLIEWEKRGAVLKLKKDIEQSWHSFETSRKTIDRYEGSIRKQAKELLDLTLEGYQLGNIDLLNLLYAQETYLSSQLRYIKALKNYYIKIIELEKYLDQELVF